MTTFVGADWSSLPVRLVPALAAKYEAVQVAPRAGAAQADLFLAFRRTDRARVIVKQYNRRSSELPRVEEPLMQAIARSRDPHLLRLIDFGSEQDRSTGELVEWEVLEHMPNGDLSEWARQRSGSFRADSALFSSAVREIVMSVQAFHRLLDGTAVHRDIKPANFLVADSERLTLKLGDYGLSRMTVNTIDITRGRVGTERYLPPEADAGDDFYFSQASDWWAVGIVVAELALGHPVFPAVSNWPALRRRLAEQPFGFLDEIQEPSIRGLVQGLLHPVYQRGVGNRWNGDDAIDWLDGIPVPIGDLPRAAVLGGPRATADFTFEGRQYRDPVALTVAMHQLWRQAIPLYLSESGPYHGELVRWLREDVGDDLAATVCASGERTPQNRLAKLCLMFTPLALRFRDVDLHPAAFAAYLAESADEHGDELDVMFHENLLHELALPSNGFGELERQWRRAVMACTADGFEPRQVHVQILSALLDQDYARQLHDAASLAAQDHDALGQDRFEMIASRASEGPEAIGRAMSLLLLRAVCAEATLNERRSDARDASAVQRVARFVRRERLQRPAVGRFEVSPAQAAVGEPVTVEWRVVDSDHVEIFGAPGIRAVESRGSYVFPARASTSLLIRARNRTGERTSHAQLDVILRPEVTEFTVSPPAVFAGDPVEIRWSVRHVTSVNITGIGEVPAHGRRWMPATHRTYFQLVAVNRIGEASARTGTVEVVDRPFISPQVVPLPFPDLEASTPLVIGPELSGLSLTTRRIDDPFPIGDISDAMTIEVPPVPPRSQRLPVLPLVFIRRTLPTNPATRLFRLVRNRPVPLSHDQEFP